MALGILLGLVVFAPGVGERDRTESAAIGTLRAIVSAEQAYASVNNGYYATVECLAAPACGERAPHGHTSFLSPDLAALDERRGYHFEFHPWPAEPRGGARTPMPTAFAVLATPVHERASASRAFCADASGTIYVTEGGTAPRVGEGRCLDTNRPLDR